MRSTSPRAIELLGVDDRRQRRQRHRAAGVAGAATARNDGEPEVDARAHHRRDFVFGVRVEHDERILDAPVGGIGHVRHAREAVEGDVVATGDAPEAPQDLAPQLRSALEIGFERIDRLVRSGQQFVDPRVVRRRAGTRSRAAGAAALRPTPSAACGCRADRPGGRDCGSPPRCRRALRRASAPIVRCDARRAAVPTSVQCRSPEQADDDLAVGERRVVVGDFAQPRRRGGREVERIHADVTCEIGSEFTEAVMP